jgi:hypothetical protein
LPANADIGDRFALPVGLSAPGRRCRGVRGGQPDVSAPEDPRFLDGWLAPVRTTVGTVEAKLFDERRGLAPGRAIALGLDDKPEDRWPGGLSASLTRRERQIAALVATG